MDYLSKNRRGSALSNEPLVISSDDLMQMHLQNERDAAECRAVTETSNRGESYYAGDGTGQWKNFLRGKIRSCIDLLRI